MQRRSVLLSSKGGFAATPIELDCSKGSCDHDSVLLDANDDKQIDIVDVMEIAKINAPPESYIRVYLSDGQGGFKAPVVTTIPYDGAWDTEQLEQPDRHEVYLRAARTPACYETLKTSIAAGNKCTQDSECSNGERCEAVIDGMKHCAAQCDRVAAYRADTSGTFSLLWELDPKMDLGSSPVQVADLNGDGNMDVLASGGTAKDKEKLYIGQGKTFAEGADWTGSVPSMYVDADGDGVLDAHFEREIVFRERAGGAGTPVPLYESTAKGGAPSRLHTFVHNGERLFSHHITTGEDVSELVIYRFKNRKPEFLHRLQIEDARVDGAVAGDFDKDGLLEVAYVRSAGSGVNHYEFAK
jgi:hypothetical protein